jgi:hypothetical protein
VRWTALVSALSSGLTDSEENTPNSDERLAEAKVAMPSQPLLRFLVVFFPLSPVCSQRQAAPLSKFTTLRRISDAVRVGDKQDVHWLERGNEEEK